MTNSGLLRWHTQGPGHYAAGILLEHLKQENGLRRVTVLGVCIKRKRLCILYSLSLFSFTFLNIPSTN